MNNRYLILDCDGVIFDSLKLIDVEVQKIKYEASDAYLQKLIKDSKKLHDRLHDLEQERDDSSELRKIKSSILKLSKLRLTHFDHKDLVLEEVLPEYKNRIDYSKIYTIDNVYPGVIELIKEIWNQGIYDKIFVNSQVNPDSEIEAKVNFFNEYLPMVQFVPVRFHLEPYFDLVTHKKNNNRKRSNKIECFKIMTGIEDLSNSSFIDDTSGVIEEAKKAGVGNCYYKTKDMDTNHLLRNAVVDTLYVAKGIKVLTKKD